MTLLDRAREQLKAYGIDGFIQRTCDNHCSARVWKYKKLVFYYKLK